MKRSLTQAQPGTEGFGQPTIMNRALASKHGVPYVHLAAFAIDVDRICGAVGEDPRFPEAFEVYLTVLWLAQWQHDTPFNEAQQSEFFDEICVSIFEGDPDAFGAQLTFAIWIACQLNILPETVLTSFARWKKKPLELEKHVRALWDDNRDSNQKEIARQCATYAMQPPLSPPTMAKLTLWADAHSEP